MSQELIEAITDMREEDAIELTKQLLESGTEPVAILEDCRQAMCIIGQRFETGDCFIPELILAGEMLGQISADRQAAPAYRMARPKRLARLCWEPSRVISMILPRILSASCWTSTALK